MSGRKWWEPEPAPELTGLARLSAVVEALRSAAPDAFGLRGDALMSGRVGVALPYQGDYEMLKRIAEVVNAAAEVVELAAPCVSADPVRVLNVASGGGALDGYDQSAARDAAVAVRALIGHELV